jgi:hypothetical protein
MPCERRTRFQTWWCTLFKKRQGALWEGWPEPWIYTVVNFMQGAHLAKSTIYTLCMHMHVWCWLIRGGADSSEKRCGRCIRKGLYCYFQMRVKFPLPCSLFLLVLGVRSKWNVAQEVAHESMSDFLLGYFTATHLLWRCMMLQLHTKLNHHIHAYH